jgi:hypothetical protein
MLQAEATSGDCISSALAQLALDNIATIAANDITLARTVLLRSIGAPDSATLDATSRRAAEAGVYLAGPNISNVSM